MGDFSSKKRCLVCVNPDLNLIDGSSIWAQTITLALAETGLLEVDFLAKRKPEREELFAPLIANANIRIVDGPGMYSGRPLTVNQMVGAAHKLDEDASYDLILVRGFEMAKGISESHDLMSRCWVYLTDVTIMMPRLVRTQIHDLRCHIRSRPECGKLPAINNIHRSSA